MNVEKRHGNPQALITDAIPRDENGSDLEKYFKQSLLSSELIAAGNRDKSKQSHPGSSAKETGKKNESDFGKYFEDSIIFPRTSCRKKDFSHLPKRNEALSSQKSQDDPDKARRENVDRVAPKEKHSSHVINVLNGRDDSNIQALQKKACDSMEDLVRDSVAVSLISNDEEYKDVIASPPLGTQDRCKLASWGLPSNILQVLYH